MLWLIAAADCDWKDDCSSIQNSNCFVCVSRLYTKIIMINEISRAARPIGVAMKQFSFFKWFSFLWNDVDVLNSLKCLERHDLLDFNYRLISISFLACFHFQMHFESVKISFSSENLYSKIDCEWMNEWIVNLNKNISIEFISCLLSLGH